MHRLMGFAVTEDDVADALNTLGMPDDDAQAQAWWQALDIPAAAQVALDCHTESLETRAEAVITELQRQLQALDAPAAGSFEAYQARTMAQKNEAQLDQSLVSGPQAPRVRM